jgi:hypothetical protein
MGRTRTAIPHFAKIVDRLLDVLVLRGTDGKFRDRRRKIVSRPVMPCTGRCIGIVAEQDKTPRSGRRVRPLQRWREVFSIAGEAPWNCSSVGEGSGRN